MRSVAIVVVLAACGSKGMPPAYPIEKFVARQEDKDTCDPKFHRGRIAADLVMTDEEKSSDRYELDARACSPADKESEPFPTDLTFDSLDGDSVCFQYGENGTVPPEIPVMTKQLEDAGVWVVATDSLATLKGPARQKPSGAGTKWTITKLKQDAWFVDSDRLGYDKEKKQHFVEQDLANRWVYKLCASGFQLAPNAKHLVVVAPAGMYGSTYQPPETTMMTPDDELDAYRERYPWSSASVMIWDLLPDE